MATFTRVGPLKDQLLAYVDDVNVVGENTDTVKKNTELY
jgi:hypothetical protein